MGSAIYRLIRQSVDVPTSSGNPPVDGVCVLSQALPLVDSLTLCVSVNGYVID